MNLEQQTLTSEQIKTKRWKELTGEEFKERLDHVKNILLRSEQALYHIYMEISEGELTLQEASGGEKKGSREAPSDRNTAAEAVHIANEFCKELGLDFHANLGMGSSTIYNGIVQAWYARLWQVQNNIPEKRADLYER